MDDVDAAGHILGAYQAVQFVLDGRQRLGVGEAVRYLASARGLEPAGPAWGGWDLSADEKAISERWQQCPRSALT
jgi:hypothetical protein